MTRVVLAILMSLWIRGVSADTFELAGLKRSYSLTLSTIESQLFAATAVHAGARRSK